jgi:hypothetical protein
VRGGAKCIQIWARVFQIWARVFQWKISTRLLKTKYPFNAGMAPYGAIALVTRSHDIEMEEDRNNYVYMDSLRSVVCCMHESMPVTLLMWLCE